MGLSLIRRGARVVPVEATPGTGWVNVITPGGGNPYIFDKVDQCLTVTATNCDGVRIYDWGKSPSLYVESAQEGKMHSAVALVSGAGFGPVVRVLNPTESTEVTIMSRPLPPPCFVGFVWGGCRGANTHRPTHHAKRRVDVETHGQHRVHAPAEPIDPRVHNPGAVPARRGHDVFVPVRHHRRANLRRGHYPLRRLQRRDLAQHVLAHRVSRAAGGGGGVIGFAQGQRTDHPTVGQRAPGQLHHHGRVAPTPVPKCGHQPRVSGGGSGTARGPQPSGSNNGVPAVHAVQLRRRVPPWRVQRALGSVEARTTRLATQVVA